MMASLDAPSSSNKRPLDAEYLSDDETDESDCDFIASSGSSSSESDEFQYTSESDDEEILRDARDWCEITGVSPAPPRFPFIGHPGPTFSLDESAKPIDCFETFFDNDITDLIVTQTNRFAEQEIRKHQPKMSTFSRSKKWQPTNQSEVKIFIGILILQGIIKKPTQEMYWSQRSILSTPIFSQIMPINRFILLRRYLHFADNETEGRNSVPNPKLWKIYNVIEHFRNKFCKLYIPEQDLSVDESLMPYKGRLSWKQYIPIKRARFGIKFFMLCEANTGYICDFVIYTGGSTLFNELYTEYGLASKVVMHLLHRFLGQGYCVTADNYYLSPELCDFLVAQKTDIYGTVRKNRKDLPKDFSNKSLQKGEMIAFQRGKVLALRWRDKKDVCLMSTVHGPNMTTLKNKRNEDIQKPKIVADYNLTMGGVDRCDQELSFHPTSRKRYFPTCLTRFYGIHS